MWDEMWELQIYNPITSLYIKKMREHLARPEGLEPPTPRFEAWYSIQLSYGRVAGDHSVNRHSA